jgi:CubicO group peptidase (beta-lactamase class C family)
MTRRLRTRRRVWSVIAISLAASSANTPVLAQGPIAQKAVPSNRDALAQLSATIGERYPTVRGVVVARGGCIVYEHYRFGSAEVRWPVYSVTKSVLSILVGIAIDKRRLRLDQKLPELLPEAAGKIVDPRAADITLRDLLTMTSGFESVSPIEVPGVWNSDVWMINRRVKYAPGSHFYYDNAGTNLISIILARAVGENVAEFARRELFAPLGIDGFEWMADMDGHVPGQSGLRLTTRDMARIGFLYLQQGRWRDRQLVSTGYVLDSTRKHSAGGDPINAGYGYLWWKSNDRPDVYFAAGANSQLIYNVPDRNLVVALSSTAWLPGGSQRFVNDVVLPAEAALSAQAPCIDRLE